MYNSCGNPVIEQRGNIPRVTGVMVQYYKVCKRELWLFAHHIYYESDYIDLGRLVHQESYSREKKNILIDNIISLDFLKEKEKIIIFEVKKSSKLEEPVKYQVFYYLCYLKQKGINVEGEIVYPKEKKKERVILSKEIEKDFPKMLRNIREVIKLPNPPKPLKKPYCKKCSYFELCWC